MISRPDHLSEVLDFGMDEAEAASFAARPRLTEAQIASMIVSDDDLRRLGRWGGEPQPRRWFNR